MIVPRGMNLHISFPIIIGTIPLRKNHGPVVTRTQLAANTAQSPQDSLPNGPGVEQPLSLSAPSLSYQACVDGAIDIKETDDSDYLMSERQFAPMYSFVSHFQPTQREAIQPSKS